MLAHKGQGSQERRLARAVRPDDGCQCTREDLERSFFQERRRSGPDCEAFCAQATQTYGACLDDWSLTWADAGYADGAAFENACTTWAWTEQQIRSDAGVDDPVGQVEAQCAAAPVETCSDVTGFDWTGE